MTALVLTAHGSADPRSSANTAAVADQLARMRPGLDVRLAFLEHSSQSLVEVLTQVSGPAIITPLLLANAYHARIDIPRQIASCANPERVWQAPVLGEDDRLVSVARQRVAELGVSRLDEKLGVLLVAIGTSDPAVNARTARVAPKLLTGTGWAGVTTAFATRPERPLAEVWAGCAAKARARWLSRHGSWRRGGYRTGSSGSPTTPASPWQRRWAHTGWWPRRAGSLRSGPEGSGTARSGVRLPTWCGSVRASKRLE